MICLLCALISAIVAYRAWKQGNILGAKLNAGAAVFNLFLAVVVLVVLPNYEEKAEFDSQYNAGLNTQKEK